MKGLRKYGREEVKEGGREGGRPVYWCDTSSPSC